MIIEDYVSFETAKLLKEKGFDEVCYVNYSSNGSTMHFNYQAPSDGVPCPTLQMAMKWIQERFNIVIIPNYEYECTDTSWCYKIFRLGKYGKPESVAIKGVSYDKDNNPTEHIVGYRDYERSYNDYTTKEEAIEEGIKYCLEKLI